MDPVGSVVVETTQPVADFIDSRLLVRSAEQLIPNTSNCLSIALSVSTRTYVQKYIMANRAYLYGTDTYSPQTWEVPGDPLYDSRWRIPVAWFFFYSPQDVEIFPGSMGGLVWQDVKLAALKEDAVSTFYRRYERLLSLTNPSPEGADLILEFIETVKGWPGTHLCINPGEVVEEPEEAFTAFVRFTRCLDDPHASLDQVIEAVPCWCIDPPEIL